MLLNAVAAGAPFTPVAWALVVPGGLPAPAAVLAPAVVVQGAVYIPVPGPRGQPGSGSGTLSITGSLLSGQGTPESPLTLTGVALLGEDGKVLSTQLPDSAPGGSGLPAGGTAGQVLTKTGSTDGLADWQTPAGAVVSPTTALVALGDSITYGDQAGGPGSAWPGLLAGLRNWTVANAGINGSTLSSGGGNPMVNRYAAAVPSGFTGHVTLLGGTNDWNQALPLGQVGSTDPSTVYGALRTLVSGILGRLGSAGTLTLLTPSWRADEATRHGSGPAYTLEQVRQAVRDEAARGARLYPGRVHLIDLGRDLRDWLSDGSGTYINADNLHPTAAGHVLIAQYLAAHEAGDSGGAPPAPTLLYGRTFSDLAPGNLSGRDDWTTYGGSAVVTTGGVTINAPFSAQPRGLLHPIPVGASRSQVRVQLGSLAAGQGIIHRAAHRLSDDRALCVWANADGAGVVHLDAGIIQGGTVTSWLAGTGPVLPADSWLELLRAGGQVEIRTWEASGTRPATATYAHADDGMVGDALGLSTIGSVDEVVTEIRVY